MINIDRIIREIDKSESIELNVEDFSDYQKGSSRIHEIFEKKIPYKQKKHHWCLNKLYLSIF